MKMRMHAGSPAKQKAIKKRNRNGFRLRFFVLCGKRSLPLLFCMVLAGYRVSCEMPLMA